MGLVLLHSPPGLTISNQRQMSKNNPMGKKITLDWGYVRNFLRSTESQTLLWHMFIRAARVSLLVTALVRVRTYTYVLI